MFGTFVTHKDWRIWVEYAWVGPRQTLETIAKDIFESEWINKKGFLNAPEADYGDTVSK